MKPNNVRISCFLSFGVVLVMRSGVSFSFCIFSDDLAFLQRLPICIVILILVFLGTTTTATNTGYCLLLAATSPSFYCTVNIFFNFILVLFTLLVWPKSPHSARRNIPRNVSLALRENTVYYGKMP